MITVKETVPYKKLKRIVEFSNSIDTAALVKEVESLHAGRLSRNLSTKELSTRKIAAASMQDQSYRSRLVEILLVTTKSYNLLSAAINASSEKLQMDLNSEMVAAGYRSISDRQSFVNSRLNFGSDRLQDIATVMELANLVIADIDQAGWSLKRTAEMLVIVSQPERMVQG